MIIVVEEKQPMWFMAVSYTHLLEGIEKTGAGRAWLDIIADAFVCTGSALLWSVSYTHLDVYKRQRLSVI